jgi:hypothetical protein
VTPMPSPSYSPPAPPASPPDLPSPAERPWYEGGTLHGATMVEWRTASYANRLATAADFVAATSKSRGITFASMDELKEQAIALELAISTAGEGGNADHQQVSEVAAACLVLMDKR